MCCTVVTVIVSRLRPDLEAVEAYAEVRPSPSPSFSFYLLSPFFLLHFPSFPSSPFSISPARGLESAVSSLSPGRSPSLFAH